MGIFSKYNPITILQSFADTGEIPVGDKIFRMRSKEFTDNLSEKYEDIEKLLNDEKIFSIVALMSSLVQSSYKGIYLKPLDRYTDSELTDDEIKVLKLADDYADPINGLDLQQLFFDFAWDLTLHGEEIFIYDMNKEEGIKDLKPVALNASYFVESQEQIKKKDTIVSADNILVIKPRNQGSLPKSYKKGEFEHMSYHRRNVWKLDIEGRETFSVYSVIPSKCLQNLYKWKIKTMENDITWKNKLMPRIKHVLKMAGFSAAQYPGKTKAEKNAAALADAKKVILDFKNSTKIDTPDEDLILSDAVTTEILEPKTTSYQDPNNTLQQINNSINTPYGIPNGQLGGAAGASMGAELDSVFESIRVDTIASIIAKTCARVIRKHLIILNPGLKDTINRLYIHIDTSLPVHKHSLARSILALAKSGVVTKAEMREMMKLPRIPQLPKEAMVDVNTGVRASDAQTTKDLLTEKPGANTNNQGPGAMKNTGESQRN